MLWGSPAICSWARQKSHRFYYTFSNYHTYFTTLLAIFSIHNAHGLQARAEFRNCKINHTSEQFWMYIFWCENIINFCIFNRICKFGHLQHTRYRVCCKCPNLQIRYLIIKLIIFLAIINSVFIPQGYYIFFSY
jgi:hypothetical protein